MFRHILVPTDLAEKSQNALEIAVKMVSNDVRKITLLHVIETLEESDLGEFEGFYQQLKVRAQKKMDKMAAQFAHEKIPIDEKIICGNRVREIVKFANENKVDLIVLSSHRIDNADAAQGWATISYRVGILASCPVMMVK